MRALLLCLALLITLPAAASDTLAMQDDKPGHIAVGAASYLGCRLLTDWTPKRCLGTALAIGLAYEVADAHRGHVSDFNDATANLFGASVVFMLDWRF